MHMQPVFKDFPYYGDGLSEKLFEVGLCLPSGSNLTEEDKGRVVGVIEKTITKNLSTKIQIPNTKQIPITKRRK